MSHKKRIIIIVIIAALIIGGVVYWRSRGTASTTTTTNPKDYFPFGDNTNGGNNNTTGQIQDTQQTPIVAPAAANKLRLIAKGPIAGFAVIQRKVPIDVVPTPPVTPPTTTTPKTKNTTPAVVPEIPTKTVTTIRYVEKATGHVFDTDNETLATHEIVNTTIPRVNEALFADNGTTVLLRYIGDDNQTIQTFGGIVPNVEAGAEGSMTDLRGNFLYENIQNMTISPDTKNIFYLVNFSDRIIGSLIDSLGAKRADVFSSAYTEWIPQFVNATTVTLTTKASAFSPGYAYSLDTKTTNLTKILGGIKGLTTNTDTTGKLILYSASTTNGVKLSLYNILNRGTFDIGVNTLPEKCVWGVKTITFYCAIPKTIQGGTYPDSWYQGKVSFDDDLFKTDIGTAFTNKALADLASTAGTTVDATNLALDGEETSLYFLNKNDGSLWVYNLSN